MTTSLIYMDKREKIQTISIVRVMNQNFETLRERERERCWGGKIRLKD